MKVLSSIALITFCNIAWAGGSCMGPFDWNYRGSPASKNGLSMHTFDSIVKTNKTVGSLNMQGKLVDLDQLFIGQKILKAFLWEKRELMLGISSDASMTNDFDIVFSSEQDEKLTNTRFYKYTLWFRDYEVYGSQIVLEVDPADKKILTVQFNVGNPEEAARAAKMLPWEAFAKAKDSLLEKTGLNLSQIEDRDQHRDILRDSEEDTVYIALGEAQQWRLVHMLQVISAPTDADPLRRFRVVLDATTGEFVDLIPYRNPGE